MRHVDTNKTAQRAKTVTDGLLNRFVIYMAVDLPKNPPVLPNSRNQTARDQGISPSTPYWTTFDADARRLIIAVVAEVT